MKSKLQIRVVSVAKIAGKFKTFSCSCLGGFEEYYL
jgi:hypothetical protein